jgi:hypothetical protein
MRGLICRGRCSKVRFFFLFFFSFFFLVMNAIASDDEMYPVQWSPKVGIGGLDEIDDLLNAPFYPEERLRLYSYDWIEQGGKHELVVVDTQIAKNCASLIEWMGMGYEVKSDLHPTAFIAAVALRDELFNYCNSLLLLKEARPARISHLRDFVFDEDAAEYLPAMVRLDVGCGEELSYKYFLEIYGRGDFNSDRFDDLLLYLEERHLFFGITSRSLLILTRTRPDEVFRVVDVYWSSRSEIFISCRTQRSTFETEGEH